MDSVPATSAPTEQDRSRVFELLKRRGPLSESQICVELLYTSLAEVHAICLSLAGENYVVRRPDRFHPDDDADPVWGIGIRFWRRPGRSASSGEA